MSPTRGGRHQPVCTFIPFLSVIRVVTFFASHVDTFPKNPATRHRRLAETTILRTLSKVVGGVPASQTHPHTQTPNGVQIWQTKDCRGFSKVLKSTGRSSQLYHRRNPFQQASRRGEGCFPGEMFREAVKNNCCEVK